MPVTYPDALEHWDRSRAFGDPRDFQSFANDMESLHPGEGFGDAANRDGWWTRLSTRLDQSLFHPIAEATTKPLGAAVGGLFGQEEAGARFGESLPRALLETAPLYLAGPEAGLPATIAAAGATGALMGAHTYAETGSAKAATVAGVTGAVLPEAGKFGGEALTKVLGLGERVAPTLLKSGETYRGGVLPTAGTSQAAYKTSQFFGSQVAQAAVNQASLYGTSKALGEPYDPLSPDFLIQQIPFTVFDAVNLAQAGKVPTKAAVMAFAKPPEPTAPPYRPPPSKPEQENNIATMITALQAAYLDPGSTPEQKAGALAMANALIRNPKTMTEAAKPGKVVDATAPVTTVTGYAKQYSNGNWKVLTLDPEGNDTTVWINGVEPTVNADGTHTFQPRADQISPNVATPFTRRDFGLVGPGEQELPTQPTEWAGFGPDQQRILEENGVPPPPPEMPEDVRQFLRDTADNMELTQQKIGEVQAAIDKNPTGAMEIPPLVGPNPEPSVQAALDAGANATQAVEKTRLKVQTQQLDAAQQQLKMLQERAKVVSTTGGEYDVNKPQAQYGDYVRDENGKNFPTRALAEAYRDADPDLADHVVINAGRGRGGFYLARQLNKEVSLEGTKLEQILGTQEAAVAPLESRPDESFFAGMEQLNRASQSPVVFAREGGFDSVPDAILAVRQAKVAFPLMREGKSYEEIQSALAKAKVAGFESKTQAFATMNAVRRGLQGLSQRFTNFTMGSQRPYDQATVDMLGIQHPDAPTAVRNTLQWYINQPETGALGKFVEAVLKAHGTDGLTLEINPKISAFYQPDGRLISLGHLPGAGEGLMFASGVVHEYMHDVTWQAMQKDTPTAVQLRATLKESIDALKRSNAIPAIVRKAMKEMPQWYKDYTQSLDPFTFYKKWTDMVGEGQDDWLHFAYGLANEHEMVSAMFESPRMIDMMMQTPMPKKPLTVMQYFSQVWNRLLGTGKAENDNVFTQILTSLDNYLSGDRIPSGTNVVPSTVMHIIGRKGSLLRNEQVNAIVSAFGQGHSVTDAFGGSGQLASFLKSTGASEVNLNIHDLRMHAVFTEIKNDPEGFANRVAKVVEPIRSSRYQAIPTLEDGSSVKDYLDTVEKTDPNVALFVRQNLNARGREVVGGSFTPSNVISSVGLKELPNRIREFAGRIDNVSNEDGWLLVSRARNGDYMTVDPPYVGQGGLYTRTGRISVDDQLANYEHFLYPAAERGAKFVVFDVADPQLMKSLQDHGFAVQEVSRNGRGGGAVQPELIATNKEMFVPKENLPQYNGRDFIRDYLVAEGVKPAALASRIATVEDVFKSGSLDASIKGFELERDNGILPSTASVGDLVPEVTKAITTGTPKDVENFTKSLLMTEVPVHEELYARMKEDVDAAVKLYSNIRKGLVPGEVPPDARAGLQYAQIKLEAMGRGIKSQKNNIQRYLNLDNFTVEGMAQTRINGLSSDRLPSPPDPTELHELGQEALGLIDQRRETALAALAQGKGARAANWVRKNFMFQQYLMDLVPATKPILHGLFRKQGTSNFWKNELDAVYEMDPTTKEFDKTRRDANFRVATQETLSNAASEIKRWNQTEEAEGRKPTLNDPYVKNVLARFNQTDRDAITSEANNARAVHEHWTEVTTPKFLAEKNQVTVATAIALREQGMKPDDARDLAGQFSAAMDALKSPQTAQTGIEILNSMRPRMQPDTFLRAFTLTKSLGDLSDDHMEFMRSRPNYVTEQRFGDHRLRMATPDNKPYYKDFDSLEEANAARQRLEAQGYTFLDYIPKSASNVPTGGIRDDFIGKLRDLDLQRQTLLAQSLQGVDPNLLATVLPQMNRANDYQDSLQAFTPVPGAGFPKRHFIAGREEINMVENQNLFYGRAVNWMRHQLTRANSELDLLHPDLLSDRELTQQMRDKVTEFLTPDSPLARKMSEFTYNWKLAGNFGVNVLHGIQSLNTGMAALVSETGSVADALALTMAAQKAVLQRNLTGKWANKDHDWLTRRAGAEGVLGNVTWDGDIGDSKRNALQYAATPLWRKPAAYLANAARTWNNAFFKFNDSIGLISAFDLGRSQGMNYEEAYNFAADVKARGYFTGGKAQRPGFWSALGPQGKAVPQLIASLQTYVNGWFSLLAYNYTRGFGKAPAGMSAAQVLGAKKAFLYQLGAQAVLAGALGLPGVGQGMALVKQATGVDVMSWLRQHLGDLFDEDNTAGGLMTTLALHGATAAFTPIDISGKHMPSVPYIGVTPYKGFDLANLAGAPVSSAADLVTGLLAAAHGDVMGASTILPEVLKGPLRLWQGEGDVRDKAGNLITKLSPFEQFVTALGMKPARVAAAQDVATAVKEASARASREKSDITDRFAEIYRKNGMEQGHIALMAYLKDHPDENGPALVREISRKVINQTTVPDWSQRANVGADLTGLGGVPASQSQRLQALQSTQASLGLQQRPSRRTEALMEEVDRLRQTDPTLSVAEAAALARRERPQRPLSLTVPPEYQ